MYPTLQQNSLCSVPAFFYPTTVLLVDDDAKFLELLSKELSKYYKTITFTDPEEAVKFLTQNQTRDASMHSWMNGDLDQRILEFRRAVYSKARFKGVLVSVLDENMPGRTGFNVMKHVDLSDYFKGKKFNSYILLTAIRYADFDKDLLHEDVAKECISKHDPNYLDYLLEGIMERAAAIFQHDCYELSIRLAKASEQRSMIFNDQNFLPIFNAYIKEHNLCEWHLFDRQGSLMLLDEDANLSWFFVRSEHGIEHSIALAKKYHAPEAIIESLKSQEFILSLYEEADFARLKQIDWEQCLLKAHLLTTQGKDMNRQDCSLNAYYAFTKDFSAHGLDRDKIFSYREFLQSK